MFSFKIQAYKLVTGDCVIKLSEKKKCLKMETQGAVKQTAQTTSRICLGAAFVFHSIDFYIRITGVIYLYKWFS